MVALKVGDRSGESDRSNQRQQGEEEDLLSVVVAEVNGWRIMIPAAEVQMVGSAQDAAQEVGAANTDGVVMLDLGEDFSVGGKGEVGVERRALRWVRGEARAWVVLGEGLWFEEVRREDIQALPEFLEGLRERLGVIGAWSRGEVLVLVLDVGLLLGRRMDWVDSKSLG